MNVEFCTMKNDPLTVKDLPKQKAQGFQMGSLVNYGKYLEKLLQIHIFSSK